MNKQTYALGQQVEPRKLSDRLKAECEVACNILHDTGVEGKALRLARKRLAEHNEAVKREQTKQTDHA